MKTGRKPLYAAARGQTQYQFSAQRGARPRRNIDGPKLPAAARGPLYAAKTEPLQMNFKQAAAYLGVSRPTFTRLVDTGRIPYRQLGPRTFRVSREDLDKVNLKQHRRKKDKS